MMSAPKSNGRARYPAAPKVLSTMSGMPCCVGDGGERLEVRDVELRVADGLHVERLCAAVDPGAEVRRVVAVHESHVDAEARQRDLELVVGAPVEGAGGDDVVARGRDGGDGQELRRLPARRGERRDPALERGDAPLEDVGRGIHDPRVDVAELLQRKKARAVRGVVERERRRLVDGYGPGVGARGRLLPGVDLQGLVAVRACVGAAHCCASSVRAWGCCVAHRGRGTKRKTRSAAPSRVWVLWTLSGRLHQPIRSHTLHPRAKACTYSTSPAFGCRWRCGTRSSWGA